MYSLILYYLSKSIKTITEEIPLTKEEEEQLALQKKLDRERREQDYLEDTRKAVSMSSIQPLGRDRIYRRYWSFRSVKGLFVEEDDPDLPTFLETIFEEENYEVRHIEYCIESYALVCVTIEYCA